MNAAFPSRIRWWMMNLLNLKYAGRHIYKQDCSQLRRTEAIPEFGKYDRVIDCYRLYKPKLNYFCFWIRLYIIPRGRSAVKPNFGRTLKYGAAVSGLGHKVPNRVPASSGCSQPDSEWFGFGVTYMSTRLSYALMYQHTLSACTLVNMSFDRQRVWWKIYWNCQIPRDFFRAEYNFSTFDVFTACEMMRSQAVWWEPGASLQRKPLRRRWQR